ncbi:nicotinate-nucleotide adenylyltransferase [Heliomicrobium gestii]|nr:nicotinate-nucleotide adenylyltransferase [Heliomicrobium gestii]MBM7866870.1 nicotinate-nucleotide adenylyltransferase [Heliomicrobium gestii]
MDRSANHPVERKGFIIGPHGVVISIPEDLTDYEWVDTTFGIKVPKFKVNQTGDGIVRVGIMGGTFDPVHFGHLVTAEAAADLFDLSVVVFVPSGRPPHKRSQLVTDPWERYRLTELATCSNPRFRMSDVEVSRPGYSYAIDTVRSFRSDYGEQAEFFFITGADAILEIMTWRQIDQLMAECRFIAAYRPGYGRDHLREAVACMEAFSGRIHLIEVPALAISSTDIRQRLAQGRSVKYLLPEPVVHRIIETGSYR